MTRNRTIRHLGAGIASLVMVAAATGCGNDDESSAPDADKPAITVGIQDFGESQVVSQVYGQHLASVGYDVDYQELGGFRDLVLTAFESGDINFTPEYAASMLEFLNDNAGEATNDVGETVDVEASAGEEGPGGLRAHRGRQHQHVRRHRGDRQGREPHLDR